jgi:hypothetical protein
MRRFTFLAILAACFFKANAQFVYVDLSPDKTICGNGGFYNADLDNDHTDDFRISINIRNDERHIELMPLQDSCFIANSDTGAAGTVSSFRLYDSIGPASCWAFVKNSFSLSHSGKSPGESSKTDSVRKEIIFGLKLVKNGIHRYGWIRLVIPNDASWFTIRDYAASTSLIQAGQVKKVIEYPEDEWKIPNNSVFFELGGNAPIFGSFNYERFLLNKGLFHLSARIGIGASKFSSQFTVSMPVLLTGIFHIVKALYAETGFGVSLMYIGEMAHNSYSSQQHWDYYKGLTLTATLGMRIQFPKGFLFRFGYTPWWYVSDESNIFEKGVQSLIGISMGYGFGKRKH